MKKLPIGIQTFSKIREVSDNFVYIDKTEIALRLIENGQYYFLSRPRRFGKSLFLDTLRNIFEGNKELFEGLHIYDRYDWEKKYPVIRISFGAGVLTGRADLNERIKNILRRNEIRLLAQSSNEAYSRERFTDLIEKIYQKYNQKVVILIDEYDKPILDNITNLEIASEIREGVEEFLQCDQGYR